MPPPAPEPHARPRRPRPERCADFSPPPEPEGDAATPGPPDRAEELASGLTRGALRRRVTVLVLFLSVIVVGVVATVGIPLELFPRGYTGHNLRVFVPWQDAPVEEVLQKITLPLEEELSTVRGLDGINSFSSKGAGGTFLRFKRGTDMDVAYREVRDRVQRARLLFPTDVDRVYIRKEDASGIPVAVIGLAIDPGLTDYYTLIKKQIVQRLERIEGVANVQTDGLEEKEILIEVDRQLAEATGPISSTSPESSAPTISPWPAATCATPAANPPPLGRPIRLRRRASATARSPHRPTPGHR
jgi:HAE1 family hydrophobic/amphiphilic exporter-1